ncbi:MAG: hypothetical protein JOZ24_11300 [Candidatus Eremiobacteraeota bacterium]|nr:hypothetical protein [Candidatus Eremiobacteraeota bacterium]
MEQIKSEKDALEHGQLPMSGERTASAPRALADDAEPIDQESSAEEELDDD